MKKTITLLMFFASIQFCSAQDSGPAISAGYSDGAVQNISQARPTMHKAPSSSSRNMALFPCDSLQTTFAAGNGHRGNMFDVVAINSIVITSFDVHPQATTDYKVFYKVGTFAGSENVPGDWTFIDSVQGVVAQPMGTPTPLPMAINITIPAGQTYAWYITSTNITINNNYTNGTTQGNVYASNANMQILEGCGIEYPFTGTPFTPRVWNGRIHYCDATTGIEHVLGTTSTEVYPNPVSSTAIINIHSSSSLKNAEMKIYNVVGEEAGAVENINGNQVVFDRKNLSAGMYIFVVKEANSVVAKGKLIVE